VRSLAALFGLAFLAHAPGPLSFPVVVHVDGKGDPARVIVSAVVRPSPCDAPSARVLFDGLVPMGSEIRVVSPTPCVCHRHANGFFRTKDLGPHEVVCFPRFAGDTLPMRITIAVK
jgi:hypothetical protein